MKNIIIVLLVFGLFSCSHGNDNDFFLGNVGQSEPVNLYHNTTNGIEVIRNVSGNMGTISEEGDISSVFGENGGIYKSLVCYTTNGFPGNMFYNYDVRQDFSIILPTININNLKLDITGIIVRNLGITQSELNAAELTVTVSIRQNGVVKNIKTVSNKLSELFKNPQTIQENISEEIEINENVDRVYLNFRCTGSGYRQFDNHAHDIDISLCALINQISFE